MKYQPPYGIADPNAPYINGNPAAGIEGSIPPAAAFEYPMREIVAMISNSNFTPSDADLLQLLKAIRRQYVNFAVDTGAANAMAITLNPPLDSYSAGFPLRVSVAATNTGATTINVNSLGARAVKRPDGSDLQAGDIVAGMIANLVDTGAMFQLQNALHGVAGTSNVFSVGIPYAGDTGAVNAIVAIYSPAITSISEGTYIAVKVGHTNTGAVTMGVNALAPIPLNRQDGQPLKANDILLNETILIENHGTYYQMVTYVPSQFPAAPTLRGFRADKAGYPADVLATSVAVNLNFQHVASNSMQTSIWDGTVLTVGAGEAGLWDITAKWSMPQIGIDTNYFSIGVYLNGSTIEAFTATNTFAGTAGTVEVNCVLKLNVGDKIQIEAYQQSGITVSATNLAAYQYIAAYLISL
jgi:hypothetical protein